ncbi:MAG: hypothetical protein JNK90_26775 [Planctomycetaceae bacterium]|jgi:hypothetical protein|nr:hypothetical protein [Planctomycetaceae bacterium]
MTKNPPSRISPNPVTTSIELFGVGGFQERTESVTARIEKWYIQPLLRMDGNQGLLVLMILFPLYEKHLRICYGLDDKFTSGHKIFRTIGKHLELSQNDAYLFWTNMRNGLLHRAIPNVEDNFRYVIRDMGKSVELLDKCFWINPFELRDRILREIRPHLQKWRCDDTPIPKTFDPYR